MHAKFLRLSAGFAAAAVVVGAPVIQDRTAEKCQRQWPHKTTADPAAIRKARQHVQRFMIAHGAPGISVAVSVNGVQTWSEGFGYSDVEQLTPCTKDVVMRIASISKPITAIVAAKLVEQGKLDLDLPIQKYIPEFPEKTFDGKKVTITARNLLNHSSGIRHYKYEKPTIEGLEKEDKRKSFSDEDSKEIEFLKRTQFKSVKEAMASFQNDELEAEPGSKYGYTTHGFTVLSAVLEGAADGKPFEKQVMELTKQLGMHNTFLDHNVPLIANRSRYYYRKPNSLLANSPEVDNSYKWAGGGLLSTVSDLLVFGNAVLYSYQSDASTVPKPLLKSTTMREFWKQSNPDKQRSYGLGWGVEPSSESIGPKSLPWNRTNCFAHAGGAVGASSYLLIKPTDGKVVDGQPAGVCVAILINLQSAHYGLDTLAQDLAQTFDSQ